MTNKTTSRTYTTGELTRDIQLGLRELSVRLHQVNEVVGEHLDLQAGDLDVLDMVARYGPLSPRDLTATLGIHPATLTGVLDRLERGGWVKRRPDPSDRRKVQIEAQHKRAGELLRLYSPMNRSLGKLCASYTHDQLEVIRDFVSRLVEASVEAAATLRSTE